MSGPACSSPPTSSPTTTTTQTLPPCLRRYTQRVRASTVRPLDRSKVLTDAKVLDDAFPSGSRPSLPTNVNDVAPRDVNVNTLR